MMMIVLVQFPVRDPIKSESLCIGQESYTKSLRNTIEEEKIIKRQQLYNCVSVRGHNNLVRIANYDLASTERE
jgi:hypothetical protein